ncbi:uncharacterized protein LOC116338942 [Contarinia nasturtii]|uniref:uncharacterized protein LOC116338942 n=1 Tax=Contarinia nasturtii TaxID=265458 RepID=UPI0012D3C0CE|nr:uncharacterized protein LOC116338942 [Contarinia nasturtii]
MKLFSIIFLLMLFVQLFNCKHVTYDTFVKHFYEKAAHQHCNIDSKLDFLLKISNITETIRSEFQSIVEPFMDNKTANKVWSKAQINKTMSFSFWMDRISGINDGQKLNKETYSNLCAQIDIDSPHRLDKDFDGQFKKWKKKPIDMQHLEGIKNSIDHMELENEEFIENFKKELKDAEQLREILSEHIARAKELLLSTLETTDRAVLMDAFGKAEPITSQITQKQSLFFGKLVEVKRTLRLYNKQRIIWVEDIMGVELKKPSCIGRLFGSLKKPFAKKNKQ